MLGHLRINKTLLLMVALLLVFTFAAMGCGQPEDMEDLEDLENDMGDPDGGTGGGMDDPGAGGGGNTGF